MDGVQGIGDPSAVAVAVARGLDKVKRDEWSEGAVLCLLEVYESKWILRNRAKLKGTDWEDIAREVSSRCSGTKALKTPNQCKNKIESMKKRYRAETAAARDPNSASSWQYYARMDGLLKGTANCIARSEFNHDIDLQTLPKMEDADEGHLQDSNRDDGSNTMPNDNNANNGNNIIDNNKKKASTSTDTDVGALGNQVANTGDEMGMIGNLMKKQKSSQNEVAESIRLLAHSFLKIEQARIEMYKDSERMRAEAEIKRGEMELKRTEIVANTQLQIAKLFMKRLDRMNHKRESSSLRAELDIIPRKEGKGD
ncbi:uncharacterized protein [Typha latifolia]|uniref:uncharacterized protein n=1 Tax=Typha latifolia TaxID=4733 RepID=UPI003C2B6AD7